VQQTSLPASESAFNERFVEAEGFRIRYFEAGTGPPLVCLHGASGLMLTPGYELLAQTYRVIAFEMPGFGNSPENTRTSSVPELAKTLSTAISNLGIETFAVLGWSFGSRPALWLALQAPERVTAIVLEAPGALRTGPRRVISSFAELATLLFNHPERRGILARPDPRIEAKERVLVSRIRGPERDPEFLELLSGLDTPTLVLFGTDDQLCTPDMGHLYKELMPNCSLVFVYDAAHSISGDRPEAFVEVVSDFLERHEAFVISRRDTRIFP